MTNYSEQDAPMLFAAIIGEAAREVLQAHTWQPRDGGRCACGWLPMDEPVGDRHRDHLAIQIALAVEPIMRR